MKRFMENFRLPADGPISDKTFMYNISAKTVGIIICLILLSVSTYCWFCMGLIGQPVKLADPDCRLAASLNNENGTVCDLLSEDSSEPLAPGSYTVVISLPVESDSGYCYINTGSAVICTRAIVSSDAPASFSFTLNVEQGASAVFSPCAGVPSGLLIKDIISNGDELTLKADGTYIFKDN